VNNSLKILDILSVREGMGLAEISRIAKLGKSSVFKILYTLENRDYVRKTQDGKYHLGIKFTTYGGITNERQSITEIAQPFMRELAALFHETVYMGVLNVNGRVIIVHKEEGDSPQKVTTRIGFEMDVHTNAMGKVLLAELDPPVLDRLVEKMTFKAYSPTTISTAKQLYAELQQVEQQGFAKDIDERYPGRSGAAAPIFDSSGHCIAALSIVCASQILEQEGENFTRGLLRAAETISRKLGYRKEASPLTIVSSR
jgi:DNA-binding IclR family transcriptional regulator